MDTVFKMFADIQNYDYSGILFWWKVFVFNISIFFIVMIVYSVRQTLRIYRGMHVFDKTPDLPEEKPKNIEEWKNILTKGSSLDENERKFAIIAADSLMDKILGMAGYEGENLGDRLKNIEPSDLDSLNDLWEAHKIRNRIAHEAGYKISKEDAEKALSNFEKALRELEFV